MAESSRVKVARHRAHIRGDHRSCRAEFCSLAGKVERDNVTGLRAAIEAEFADDPARLAIARRQVELAAGTGPAAGVALRELGQTVEAKRRGELTPAVAPTVDDEIRALVAELAVCRCACHTADGHVRGVG